MAPTNIRPIARVTRNKLINLSTHSPSANGRSSQSLYSAFRSNKFECHRHSSTAADEPDLKSVLREIIPEKRELLKEIKSKADKKIGDVKVENVLGGMRGLKSMIWEGSVLDANEGIRFHSHTIADCDKLLPKGKTGRAMLPEAMFWLLLTGRIPSENQIRQFSKTLAKQVSLPPWLLKITERLPCTMHPMIQLSVAVSALAMTSSFARLYAAGKLEKKNYWEPAFDDAVNLIAKLPVLAANIYHRSCLAPPEVLPRAINRGRRTQIRFAKEERDWAHNFAALLGYGTSTEQSESMQDLLRLYMAIHADHEGGNVSAHATHLVGSALSNPYLSYSAGLQGLAGPLHG